MEKFQITQEVKAIVEKWIDLQVKNRATIKITDKAISFLIEIIENIEQDPSDNWIFTEFNKSSAQELAISYIPNALNEIIHMRRFRFKHLDTPIKITTWEIWHSMSLLLRNWCFIPKDI